MLLRQSFGWLRNIVHERTADVTYITHLFVDSWNLCYLKMNRKARAKKLVTITKRFAEHLFDSENREYRRDIHEAVTEYCYAEGGLGFEGLEYPEETEW